MQLTPRRHELVSIWLMSIGTLFLYFGYFTQSFICEGVIHSTYTKDPNKISKYAGYYGQAVHYTAFAISSIFSASLMHYLSSKWMLVLATCLFAMFYMGFFYINSYYYYFSQITMGIAYSIFNNGEGAYLAEHSSKDTVESNTSIETGVGHASMLFGGLTLLLIFSLVPADPTIAGIHHRTFSDGHIKAIYGCFLGLTLVSTLIFASLPTKQYDSIAQNTPQKTPSFGSQLKALAKTSIHLNMVLLTFTFFYFGLEVSFLLGIYPTTLSFTASLVQDYYIIPLYAISLGLAELSGILLVLPLLKRCGSYKLIVTIAIHFVALVTCMIFFKLSVPEKATIKPTNNNPMWFAPSRTLTCTIGCLLGFADFMLTMARAVICQQAVPQNRMQAFSLTRIHQCISSCVVLFLSPYLPVTRWAIVLTVSMVIGVSTFVAVVRRTNTSFDTFSSAEQLETSESNKSRRISIANGHCLNE